MRGEKADHWEDLAAYDDEFRDALASTLPEYIPTLRYLYLLRFHEVRENLDRRGYEDVVPIMRKWICWHVSRTEDGRARLDEIPLWKGDRVMELCREAMDATAFETLDGESNATRALRTIPEYSA